MLIALHLAVLALLFPGDAGALARVGMLAVAALAPAVLCVLFVSHGPVVRVLLAGLIGLGATVAGLATSVSHAALTGMGGADVTGILATDSGIALVVLAFWIGLRGRRVVVKLAGGDHRALRDRAVADRSGDQRGLRDARPAGRYPKRSNPGRTGRS